MQVESVVAYSPWDFLTAIQDLILDGYRLSDKNEHFPYIVNGLCHVSLVKEDIDTSQAEDIYTQESDQEQPTVGAVYQPDPVQIDLPETIIIEEQLGAARAEAEASEPPKRGRKPKQ